MGADVKRQFWETCKYRFGNLDIDVAKAEKANPDWALWRKIRGEEETAASRFLKENDINECYYCQCPEMVDLGRRGFYFKDGVINNEGKFVPSIKLFTLDLSDYIEGPVGPEPLEDAGYLERIINMGLRMCAHCRFYQPDGDPG